MAGYEKTCPALDPGENNVYIQYFFIYMYIYSWNENVYKCKSNYKYRKIQTFMAYIYICIFFWCKHQIAKSDKKT